MIPTMVILGVVVLLVLIFIGMYNGLIRGRNEVKNAWAQIDVQLKRRHDLIPNLIETTRGYMTHERETFDSIAKARSAAQSAVGSGVAAQAAAEGQLSGFLTRFFAVAENYPELKANQNFLALQEELSSTENKISFARQFYNDQVLSFNNKIQMFPSNLIAGMFNFAASPFFEIDDATEREVPKVSF